MPISIFSTMHQIPPTIYCRTVTSKFIMCGEDDIADGSLEEGCTQVKCLSALFATADGGD